MVLFYLIKATCWLILGTLVDVSLDVFSISGRFETIAFVCIAIFIFEMLMDKTGGNQKLSQLTTDR